MIKNLALILVWIALYAALWIALPESFGTYRNFETIARQTIIVGLAAIGMTYIIVVGAIDLSVGSLVALVTVVVALGIRAGLPPGAAAVGGMLVGALAGLVNGTILSRLKVGAFIVTLASLLAFRGIAKGLASEQKVEAPDTWLSTLTASVSIERPWLILPVGAWILLLLAMLASWALKNTAFGRHTVAVGSNEATAKMCGINPVQFESGFLSLLACFLDWLESCSSGD